MTALNLEGKTEAEVRDIDSGESKNKGGRPQTNSKRTDAERERDRKRYHERKSAGKTAQQPNQVKDSLARVIDRLAERQEAREDEELANALRQDGAMMANSASRLVKLVPVLGGPILIVCGLVEPFLAFGRVAGILRRRLLDRRLQANIEAEQPEEPVAETTPVGVYRSGVEIN